MEAVLEDQFTPSTPLRTKALASCSLSAGAAPLAVGRAGQRLPPWPRPPRLMQEAPGPVRLIARLVSRSAERSAHDLVELAISPRMLARPAVVFQGGWTDRIPPKSTTRIDPAPACGADSGAAGDRDRRLLIRRRSSTLHTAYTSRSTHEICTRRQIFKGFDMRRGFGFIGLVLTLIVLDERRRHRLQRRMVGGPRDTRARGHSGSASYY